jgi:hypothetical protein
MSNEVEELVRSVKFLLEWLPVCSVGSSGHSRRVAVEKALARMAPSIKELGVEADLKHPGNDTGGETAKFRNSCNRHGDCAAADAKAKAAGHFSASHCHDDCCEDCFGC